MPDAPVELDELVDLRLLPAWVNQPPAGERYAQHKGEDRVERPGRDDRRRKGKRPSRPPDAAQPFGPGEQRQQRVPRDRFRGRKRERGHDRRRQNRHRAPVKHTLASEKPLPKVEVKFLPRPTALENVVEQIRSGTVAYSLFAMARLFLEKPTRYEVKLTAPTESPLFQLGEHGAVSSDREFLDRSAFRLAKSDFYKVDITETEPIRGNFTNVARCRLSGTLLGPTNHHDYQRRLRNLYEQRFSRRMSFPEYQHKIEIVSDPVVVEKWKDDARKHTTFTTLRAAPAQTFPNDAEAERHFRQHHLDGLIQPVVEATITTGQIADRALRRVVEEVWNGQTKSPSAMMQELATRFRESGLHIFRHRRGMLFVSPIYPRAIAPDAEVSPQVRSILQAIAAQPRIGRKELADKLIDPSSPDSAAFRPARLPHSAPAGDVVDLKEGEEAVPAANDSERAKLVLASDLKWLIDGGHVIEFNDGSLDLPRVKVKPKEQSSVETGVSPANEPTDIAPDLPATEEEVRVEPGVPATPQPGEGAQPPEKQRVEAPVSVATESEGAEIGGS